MPARRRPAPAAKRRSSRCHADVASWFPPRSAPLLAWPLLVEPDVLEAPFVVDAVGHPGPSLEPGLAAGGTGRIEDHRPERRFRQLALRLPDDLFALFGVCGHRLLVDQLVELGVAVAGIVARSPGVETLVEHLVRVVDAALDRHHADREILARHLRIPERGVDEVELSVDADFLELRDHDDRRIAPPREVARGNLKLKRIVRAVAELLYDLTRLGAVL